MKPISPEALFKDNLTNIPAGSALDCNTPVDFQSHHCIKDQGRFMIYIGRNRYSVDTHSDSLTTLSTTAEFFIRYGKSVGQWVLTACDRLAGIVPFGFIKGNPRYDRAVKAVDCIREGAIKETITLPTEISEFYNTTIRPSIEPQTEFSATIRPPYANNPNMTSETPPQIEGPSQSNGTIAYCVGGVGLGLGCLIASMAAIAWKRTTLNEKRRKRYQEMVTSIVKSSENNSLISQNPIV